MHIDKLIKISLRVVIGLMCLFWVGFAIAGIYDKSFRAREEKIIYEDKYKDPYERIVRVNKELEVENAKFQAMVKQCIEGLKQCAGKF